MIASREVLYNNSTGAERGGGIKEQIKEIYYFFRGQKRNAKGNIGLE